MKAKEKKLTINYIISLTSRLKMNKEMKYNGLS